MSIFFMSVILSLHAGYFKPKEVMKKIGFLSFGHWANHPGL
jgi:hypothetical protein